MKKYIITIAVACISMLGFAQVVNIAPALIGSWNGKLKVGAKSLTLVFHFEQADGYVVCTVDSPDQGAKGLGVYKEYLSEDSVSLKMANIGAVYRAKLSNGKLVGTFSQLGMNFPLTLEKGEYKPNRPQTPVEPYPYKTEEVTFYNSADEATLAGTLTYPVGYENMKNVPVVIMVTGSGLQNRDEELFDHKPFLVITDYLARNGVASLRYDDRAFGASTGGKRVMNEATTLDYKRDAEAGVLYLRGLNKFGQVGVIGHSEGGNIAFMLGSDKCVDFVVSLAGVGTKVDVALTAQYNEIIKHQSGAMPISVEQYRNNLRALNSAWMNWFIDYDPTADISATACPVLAINGNKDCQVISALNLPAIAKALPENSKSLIKEYPFLNHMFQRSQTGLPTEYSNIEETISPEVLKDIAEWINKLKE